MYFRLKYYLLTSAALCLLASCSADETSVDEPSQGPAMEFSVGSESRSSRADNPAISRFTVFSDMHLNTTNTPLIMMYNTEVTYNPATDRWEYIGTQYWYTDFEHSFVAVHPVSVFSSLETATQYSENKLSFKYTLPTDRTQTADILAATHRRLYKQTFVSTADVVMMRFGHLMSQINISAALGDNTMGNEEYIEFRELKMSGFRSSATFSVTPASLLRTDRTDDRLIEVSGLEGDGNLAITFARPVKIMNGAGNVTLFNAADALIMLPQSFASGSDAQITLSYTTNTDPSIKQLTLPLDNQSWESGKSYTYRFTIDKTGPNIAPTSITDWEVINVGDLDVR